MFKRSLAPAIAGAFLATVVVLVPIASAAHPSHPLKLTLHSFTTGSSTRSDQPGTRNTGVGLISGQPVGEAVSTLRDKVISASQTAIKFVGLFTIYTLHGELIGRIRFTVKPKSTGGATGSGSGQLIRGTGRYKGATGSFSFTGTQGPGAPDFTAHLTGHISY